MRWVLLFLIPTMFFGWAFVIPLWLAMVLIDNL